MAFETGFVFCNDARLSQAGPFTGPMGGVAIRTFHCPLEDFVRIGKIEFRFDILVAGETEVGFFLLQEILAHRVSREPDGNHYTQQRSAYGPIFQTGKGSSASRGTSGRHRTGSWLRFPLKERIIPFPSASACFDPGPWQDSHPFCSRATLFLQHFSSGGRYFLKASKTSGWHCLQASAPIYSAFSPFFSWL